MKDTEQSIIEAAILIFNEDLSAPLEKVAEKAETTRRTLHRYFKDRKELMQRCEREIRRSCALAMNQAYNSSEDPVIQLENMFYAGIQCGTKHTFLHKLHQLHDHAHEISNKDCVKFEQTFQLWTSHLKLLQTTGMISAELSADWIQNLYNGIVAACITSLNQTQMNQQEVKKFAWYSFSRGIGI
jgi:AcrR family transcriptional regulator